MLGNDNAAMGNSSLLLSPRSDSDSGRSRASRKGEAAAAKEERRQREQAAASGECSIAEIVGRHMEVHINKCKDISAETTRAVCVEVTKVLEGRVANVERTTTEIKSTVDRHDESLASLHDKVDQLLKGNGMQRSASVPAFA